MPPIYWGREWVGGLCSSRASKEFYCGKDGSTGNRVRSGVPRHLKRDSDQGAMMKGMTVSALMFLARITLKLVVVMPIHLSRQVR